MSYTRVIPRDLFNEAKLLKCLGKLVIEAENTGHRVEVQHDGDAFDVHQNDYGLFVSNVEVYVNGELTFVMSAYNSKKDWPLVALDRDENMIEVFTEDGRLTEEFLNIK